MSDEQKKSNPPVLRNKDDVALWPTKEGDKALLSGHVTVDGQKVYVRAFLNDTDKEGNHLAHPYLSLTTNSAEKGQPPEWKTIAFGNAMNNRSDGKPVYFDQVIFNVAGSQDTFSAFVAKGCTAELHHQLGFTSERVPRPEKEHAETPEGPDEFDEPEGSAPSP